MYIHVIYNWDITGSFEKREYTLEVFIDLSKALNSVAHQVLIKKLKYHGIDGTVLERFKSYLVIGNSTYPPKMYHKTG